MGKAATATYQWFQRLAARARNGSAKEKNTFTDLHIHTTNNTSDMGKWNAVATRNRQLHLCTKCASRATTFQAKIHGRIECNSAQGCNSATRAVKDPSGKVMADNHCNK